jgi:hypothetical protein
MITRLVPGGNDARRGVSERIATFYAISVQLHKRDPTGKRSALDKKRQETINNVKKRTKNALVVQDTPPPARCV